MRVGLAGGEEEEKTLLENKSKQAKQKNRGKNIHVQEEKKLMYYFYN